jgi:peptidoglycan/LPS O-acetylase OafA/YrhL
MLSRNSTEQPHLPSRTGRGYIPPIMYLGKISYGIYVFHVFVPIGLLWVAHQLGRHYSDAPGPANFILVSLTTIALAALSWQLFERPINDLKRHFPYRDDRRAELAAASLELLAAAQP